MTTASATPALRGDIRIVAIAGAVVVTKPNARRRQPA
jgi:hypothetical protein